MAPIFKTSLVALVAAAGLLPSLTLAAPFNNLNKRKIVWETKTDVVWTTIDVTTTVYVPNYTPQAHTAPPAAVTTTADGGQFFDRPSKHSTSIGNPAPESPTTQAPPPPPPPAPTTTQAPSPPPPAAPAPEVSSSSSPAPAPAPASTPAASPPAQPQAQVASSQGSGSSNGQCTQGSPCSGDITYYDAGLGACGITNDGTTEDVMALPVGIMGSQSNGNPFCGMKVTIKNGGKTASGTVVDKCMGCVGESIDLSRHLYNQLADEGAGRVHGVEWFFT